MRSRTPLRGGAAIAVLIAVVLSAVSMAAWFGGTRSRPSDPFTGIHGQPFTVAGTLEEPLVFAVVGDFGTNNSNEAAVANLISDDFVPEFIVTVGDNSYGAAGMDVNVGQYYQAFIGDYSGAFGAGSATNRFFPAAGNHEWDDGGGIDAYLSFFNLPGAGIASSNTSGNERYYDFIQGPVHCFVVSSDAREPGGNLAHDPLLPADVQAQWLKSALAASTAPWKLVFLHHPPYSSGTGHGSETDVQWPFEAWGASAVIAGHDHTYERILRDDNSDGAVMPYFVNGLGGRERHGFPANGFVTGSAFRYAANFGAMRLVATSTRLDFEFHSIAGGGTLIDSYSLGIAAPVDLTLEVNGSQPASRLQSIAGAYALSLDMDPGSVDHSMLWAVGFLYAQQLRFLTSSGGVSPNPQAIATTAPVALSNAPVFSTNLPDQTSLIAFMLGVNGNVVEAYDFVGATTSSDPQARVRLEANGAHPETNIVSASGAITVSIDVDPQGASGPLNWYFARGLNGQLRFIGPSGAVSVQPVVFESGPPVAAVDRLLPAATLAAGQTAVFFYYGLDGTEIEVLDSIVVRRIP
jgi:hypothetical protein